MGAVSIVREGDAMASFPYYQLPQFFFSAEFRAEHKLSIEAKVLYAIMQSRVQLSKKTIW